MSNVSLLDWINIDDSSQCEWAKNYLFKKGYVIKADTYEHFFHEINIALHDKAQINPKNVLTLISLMKSGWRAEKHRKSLNKRSYSFVMSKEAGKQLKKLAGKMPLNQTLELIINNEHKLLIEDRGREASFKFAQKIAKGDYNEQISELGAQIRLKEKEISTLNSKIGFHLEKIRMLLDKSCLQEQCILEGLKSLHDISADQVEKAKTKSSSEFETYKQIVKMKFADISHLRRL